MIRKLLSGLLAGLLTVSLCACGGMIPGAKIRRGRRRFQRLTETGNRRRNRKCRNKEKQGIRKY